MNENAPQIVLPEVLSPGQADAMVRAEVDVAVATAKRYPRSIAQFHKEMEEAIASDPELSERSYYSLERSGKLIQGPSIRFAELVVYAWRNTMTGVRVMGETADGRFVVAQAVGFDLERGTRYSEEVPRRITNRDGQRYGDDMVAVTIRAASAIARREIYLRLVPAAVYRRHFAAARAVVIGADLDQAGRIAKLGERAEELGIKDRKMMLRKVGKRKLSELTEKDLLHLWGFLNAVDDNMLSLRDAFPGNGGGDAEEKAEDVIKAAEEAAQGTEDTTTTKEGENT